jgi:hypothetical protein
MNSNNLFKLFFIVMLFVALNYLNPKTETLANISDYLHEMIDKIDISQLRYNYKYDYIMVDELAHDIQKRTETDKILLRKIKSKLIDIYDEILNNGELRKFLQLFNLIDKNGMPSFINENEKVLLNNEIKILLITMPENIWINLKQSLKARS